MGCGTSKNGDVREPVLRTASAPLGLQESRTADAEPIRRSASAQPASGSAQRGLGEAAGEAGNIAIHHHVVSSGTVVINVSEAQQACTRHEDGETTAAAVREGGSGESLDGIGVQVFSQCADIRNGASGESEQGLKQFASALASCAEGAFTMLDSFGPVGPLFKALGMFMHFVGKVQSAQGEGQRLQLWGSGYSNVCTLYSLMCCASIINVHMGLTFDALCSGDLDPHHTAVGAEALSGGFGSIETARACTVRTASGRGD